MVSMAADVLILACCRQSAGQRSTSANQRNAERHASRVAATRPNKAMDRQEDSRLLERRQEQEEETQELREVDKETTHSDPALRQIIIENASLYSSLLLRKPVRFAFHLKSGFLSELFNHGEQLGPLDREDIS